MACFCSLVNGLIFWGEFGGVLDDDEDDVEWLSFWLDGWVNFFDGVLLRFAFPILQN